MGSYERPLPLAAGNRVPGQGATTLGELPVSGENRGETAGSPSG